MNLLSSKKTRQKIRLAMGALLLVATPLFAQGAEPAEPAEPGAPGDGAEPATPAQPLFRPSEADVPVARFQGQANEYLVEMRASLTKGLEILREARETMDALRLQCVNEKITAMKGILRISEDAFISLQEAMATRATERARYEFNKIRTSKNKMAELLSAAQNCVGAEATYTGGSDLRVEVDESVVADDPYYGDQDFFFTPEDTLPSGDTDGVGDDEPIETRPPQLSLYTGA